MEDPFYKSIKTEDPIYKYIKIEISIYTFSITGNIELNWIKWEAYFFFT